MNMKRLLIASLTAATVVGGAWYGSRKAIDYYTDKVTAPMVLYEAHEEHNRKLERLWNGLYRYSQDDSVSVHQERYFVSPSIPQPGPAAQQQPKGRGLDVDHTLPGATRVSPHTPLGPSRTSRPGENTLAEVLR